MDNDNNGNGNYLNEKQKRVDELRSKYEAIEVDTQDGDETEVGIADIPITSKKKPAPVVEEGLAPALSIDDFIKDIELALENSDSNDSDAGFRLFPEEAAELVVPEPVVQQEPIFTPPPEPEPELEPEPEIIDTSYDLSLFGSSDSESVVPDGDTAWLDAEFDKTLNEINKEPDFVSTYIHSISKEENEKKATDTKSEPLVPLFEPKPVQIFVPIPEPEITAEPEPEPEIQGFTFDESSGMSFDSGYDEPLMAIPQAKEDTVHPKKKAADDNFSKNYLGGAEAPIKKEEVKKKGFFRNNIIISKADSALEKVRKLVMLVAVLAIIGSGGYLLYDYIYLPYATEKQIGNLEEMVGDSNDIIGEDSSLVNQLTKKYPGVTFPEGMLEKHAELYAKNSDYIGWLRIDAFGISLPVVQGENNEQYLKIDFNRNNSKYGSLFVNSFNNIKELDMNTSIFGHHMKDKRMFGNLVEYKTSNGYKKAPIIEFNTIYGDFKWKVFAAFITNGLPEGDLNKYIFNYIFRNLPDTDALNEYLGELKLRSLYYPEVDIALTDKLLTLSTCTYEFDEARFVVVARMLRPGESESVNVNAVRYNANPRYPQAWYSKKGLSNPYKNASQWTAW